MNKEKIEELAKRHQASNKALEEFLKKRLEKESENKEKDSKTK